MLDYVVLYKSQTGNTKKIATCIFSSLPGISKDLLNIDNCTVIPEAATYFIGFCVHHGTCGLEISDILGDLSNKNIALFATCALANCPAYYQKIEKSALIWLENDNHYLGSFFCQGKMPLKIRQKFEIMLSSMNCNETKLKKQLQNFDEAMIHPGQTDFDNAALFTQGCLATITTYTNESLTAQ